MLGTALPSEGLKLDGLAEDARKILAEEDSSLEAVNGLLQLGGSSGGARPKIVADVAADGRRIVPEGVGGEGFSPWLIKFHSREDGPEQGLAEYAYSIMARECGIDMPETRLSRPKQLPAFSVFAVLTGMPAARFTSIRPADCCTLLTGYRLWIMKISFV